MISDINYFDNLLNAGNEEFEFIFRSLVSMKTKIYTKF